jgi:hypothetical protein
MDLWHLMDRHSVIGTLLNRKIEAHVNLNVEFKKYDFNS